MCEIKEKQKTFTKGVEDFQQGNSEETSYNPLKEKE